MKRLHSTVQAEPTHVGECLRDRQGCAVSGGRNPERASCGGKTKGVRPSGYAESTIAHRVKHRTPAKGTHQINSPLRDGQENAGQKEVGKYCMPVKVTNYTDVAARAEELGCRVPVGIALLPGNFLTARSAAEFCYHEAAASVRSAWRNVGLIDVGPDRQARPAPTSDGPTSALPVHLAVFFGAGLLCGGAGLVTLALGMVAAVLTERPGPGVDPRDVRFDAIVERPNHGGYACLEYHGDAYELVALAWPVRGIWAGVPHPETGSHEDEGRGAKDER